MRSKQNTPDFASAGLPTTHPLAAKLWLASAIQGHRNPFGKPLHEYNVAQLDFVLEMAAIDQPDRYSFVRNNIEVTVSQSAGALAKWTDVLLGQMLGQYFAKLGLTSGNLALATWRSRRGGGMRPGLSKGGKALDGGDPSDGQR